MSIWRRIVAWGNQPATLPHHIIGSALGAIAVSVVVLIAFEIARS